MLLHDIHDPVTLRDGERESIIWRNVQSIPQPDDREPPVALGTSGRRGNSRTGSEGSPRRRGLRPWSALAFRDYRILWLSGVAQMVTMQMRTLVSIVWLYDVTGSGLQLGLLGVIQLVMQLPAILYGGALAGPDRPQEVNVVCPDGQSRPHRLDDRLGGDRQLKALAHLCGDCHSKRGKHLRESISFGPHCKRRPSLTPYARCCTEHCHVPGRRSRRASCLFSGD